MAFEQQPTPVLLPSSAYGNCTVGECGKKGVLVPASSQSRAVISFQEEEVTSASCPPQPNGTETLSWVSPGNRTEALFIVKNNEDIERE